MMDFIYFLIGLCVGWLLRVRLRGVGFVGVVLVCISCISALPLAGQEKRTYHHYTIQQVAAVSPSDWGGKHLSHIEVDGWVTYVKREGDGDLHIRLCDSPTAKKIMDVKHCMVAEVIPSLTPAGNVPVKKGMHLTVRGIYRYDAENPGHHWHEVHPVEALAEADASSEKK